MTEKLNWSSVSTRHQYASITTTPIVRMTEIEQKIIASARENFFRYGFKKTSIDEVASTAGVGKGTIYNYFSSKEELFKKTAGHWREVLLVQLKHELSSITDTEAYLRARMIGVVKMARRTFQQFSCTPAVIQELMEVAWDLGFVHETEIEDMNLIFHRGVEQGCFRDHNIDVKARTFVWVFKRCAAQWASHEDEACVEAEIDNLMTLVIEGLK